MGLQSVCVLISSPNVYLGVMVAFTQSSFTAVENTGSLNAVLQLIGGTFSTQLSIAVTPSQQTPVSAEGNLQWIDHVLTEECLINRRC